MIIIITQETHELNVIIAHSSHALLVKAMCNFQCFSIISVSAPGLFVSGYEQPYGRSDSRLPTDFRSEGLLLLHANLGYGSQHSQQIECDWWSLES